MAIDDQVAREGNGVNTEVSDRSVVHAITWRDVLCVGPIVLHILYVFFGRFFTAPLLAEHPVLLEVLRGSIPSMVQAGASVHLGRTPLWQAMLAPVLILMIVDPFYYWAGRLYGRRLVNLLAENDRRWRRRLAFAERFFARWGAWTIVFSFFLPGSVVFYLAAGEVGMPILVFIVADVAGSLLWISLMVGLGYVFFQQSDSIAGAVTHYASWVNWATVAFIVISAIWRGMRNSRVQDADDPA